MFKNVDVIGSNNLKVPTVGMVDLVLGGGEVGFIFFDQSNGGVGCMKSSLFSQLLTNPSLLSRRNVVKFI
jgi:hypothetical protein